MSHDLFDRKQFQLERMILFSDAVFAIAITLLVIEIKVPNISSGEELWHDLRHKWYEFFGVALSFAVIGQFWTTHHRLFGHVTNYDNKLLWLNLHLLFWIILMPFSSGLNSKHGNLNAAWSVYCFNMFMIGISVYFIWRHVLNPKHDLSALAQDPYTRKMARTRSLLIAFVFLSGVILASFHNQVTSILARMVFILIFPAIIISKKMGAKHLARHQKNNPHSESEGQ